MSFIPFRRQSIQGGARRHESVWHVGGERLGAGSGALAGGGGGGEHGQCRDHAYGGGGRLPAANAGVSRPAPGPVSAVAGWIAEGNAGGWRAGGAGGRGYVADAEPL